MSVRHLQRLNDNEQIEERKANIFYHKVDLSNVGIVGHSQGGVGVFNAITAQAHRDVYKAAVSLSPTNKELAHALEWDYDATLADTPIMLISGAGGTPRKRLLEIALSCRQTHFTRISGWQSNDLGITMIKANKYKGRQRAGLPAVSLARYPSFFTDFL